MKQQTIRNCFVKAGFAKNDVWDLEDMINLHELRSQLPDVQSQLKILFETWNATNYEAEITFFDANDYINIDKEVLVAAVPSDLDILESIQIDSEHELSSGDEENHLPEPKKPTSFEVDAALKTISLALQTTENIPHHLFNKFNVFEKEFLNMYKKKHQTLINKFFMAEDKII